MPKTYLLKELDPFDRLRVFDLLKDDGGVGGNRNRYLPSKQRVMCLKQGIDLHLTAQSCIVFDRKLAGK